MALAVAGSNSEQSLSPTLIAVGEVGLAGEVRAIPGAQRRLSEAARLGFRSAIVPRGALELGQGSPLKAYGPIEFEGMKVIEVDNLGEATRVAFTAP